MASPKVGIDDEIEEEIEENISMDDDNLSLEDKFDINLSSPNNSRDENAINRKRKLFDFDDDDDDNFPTQHLPPGPPKFGYDFNDENKVDELLSGDNLAQHFNVQDDNDDDKIELDKNEDVILINDQKITITSLKNLQQTISQEAGSNNQSTTNDISDIIADDLSANYKKHVETRKTKSFEENPNQNSVKLNYYSLDHTFEFDESAFLKKPDASDNLLDIHELSSIDSKIDINNEEEMDKLLAPNESPDKFERARAITPKSSDNSISDDIKNLKDKINSHSSSLNSSSHKSEIQNLENKVEEVGAVMIRPMEKIPMEHSKEALDDISEVSEPNQISEKSDKIKSDNESDVVTMTRENVDGRNLIEKGQEFRRILEHYGSGDHHDIPPKDIPVEVPPLSSFGNGNSSDFDSVVSLNMFHMMENRVKELNDIIAGKDVCLAALNMQLEAYSRRESLKENRDSLKELPSSDRASSSLTTNSTEYRTIPDEYTVKNLDFHNELLQRDNLIEQLTDSLQQSLQIRDDLQVQAEKLTSEVSQLRKQLTETYETVKKQTWNRQDRESTGPRLSEISIDLVSMTDEESEKNFNEGENRETHQDSIELEQLDELYDQQLFPSLSKQIEQFLKFLTPDEKRLFNMVQKKFDEYLKQEIDDVEKKHEGELKILTDRYESEKNEKDTETVKLRQLLSSVKSGSSEIDVLRQELETKHQQEMENLRLYFERKCTELEKQYSEDIYSQQSRRHSNDSGSELSDPDNMIDDVDINEPQITPKKTKTDLYLSPTHRKITPTNIGSPSRNTIKISSVTKSVGMEIQNERVEENQPDIGSNEKSIKTLEEDEYTSVISGRVDTNVNEQHEINLIISEYDRRLQEQVKLARQDVLDELDKLIKTLLSETSIEDSYWPPELILLREKFTAKSQLEIAQLQIKHEEEMARLKSDFEKQLTRKIKRHTTFDSSRDLDEIVSERNNLRELSNTLRWLLSELAKYCLVCENDLNDTLIEQLEKHGINHRGDHNDKNILNISMISTKSSIGRSKLDVTGILAVIEEPSLIEFVTSAKDTNFDFKINIDDCLEKLRNEALYLLKLSQNLNTQQHNETLAIEGKEDSCEEEDGLKKCNEKKRIVRTESLNDAFLENCRKLSNTSDRDTRSLPLSWPVQYFEQLSDLDEEKLKLRLIETDEKKSELEDELNKVNNKNDRLTKQLTIAKQQIETLENQREVFLESFGSNLMSPRHQLTIPKTTNVIELQERARNLLNQSNASTMPNNNSTTSNANLLLQLVEDFCRESDRFMEENKRDKDDLQSQQNELSFSPAIGHSVDCDKIDAADKQLKATRNFLEEQAAEREIERDEFMKEIDSLKCQLKDREKEKNSYERVSKEIEAMETQIKDMNVLVTDYEEKKAKLENDLKDSIDKIYVLREIISELENQLEQKNLNLHLQNEKLQELELFINNQNKMNESLQQEVISLKHEVDDHGCTEKILNLEEKLKKSLNTDEQNQVLEQMTESLRDIETTLDKKTKTLESLHSAICSVSCSSPSEDVSIRKDFKSNVSTPRSQSSLPIDEVQRIMEKLNKHTRAEEAAIKRIQDLEMQVRGVRQNHEELQMERDALQEKLSEQMMKITSLQSRLDEQRLRAEELHRQGTSTLNIRLHDMQAELSTLKETLSSRDKQIAILKNHLEESKQLIDKQEEELHQFEQPRSGDTKLENELKQKNEEITRLKEKIKNEMINKLALPDLMETMLADKNDELDHMKEKLEAQEKELKLYLDLHLDENQIKELQKIANEIIEGKASARTLSDIVSFSSEYDEIEAARKCSSTINDNDGYTFNIIEPGLKLQQSAGGTLNYKRAPNETTILGVGNSNVLSGIAQPGFFTDISPCPRDGITPPQLEARQLHFSSTDDTNSTEKNIERNKLQTSSIIGEIQKEATIENKNLSDIVEEEQDVDKLREQIDRLQQQIKIIPQLETEVESLKLSLDAVTNEKNNSLTDIKLELKAKINEISNLQIELLAKEKLFEDLKNDKRQLEHEVDELKMIVMRMEKDIKLKENEIKSYVIKIEELHEDIENLSARKSTRNGHGMDSLIDSIDSYKQQIDLLNKTILQKDDIIIKFEKDIIDYASSEKINIERIQNLEEKILLLAVQEPAIVIELRNEISELNLDLIETKHELSDKMIEYEKCLLDLKQKNDEIDKLKNLNDREIKESLLNEMNKNNLLVNELEKLRREVDRAGNSSSPKPFSLDEITKQVEKELNYSAQLDSNILKAIESDDLNSDLDQDNDDQRKKVKELLKQSGDIDDEFKQLKKSLESEIQRKNDLMNLNNDLMRDLEQLRFSYETEKINCARLQNLLDSEKKNSTSIQQQDGNIIEAMRVRLEAANENEADLQKRLDEERDRTDRLTIQLSTLQQREIIKSNNSSFTSSPRKSIQDAETISRLESELLFLTAQNEREKERHVDLQRVLERERIRFDKEITERKEFCDKMKKELERIAKEKEVVQKELDYMQEKHDLAKREIDSLEVRLNSVELSSTDKLYDRREMIESRRIREKIHELEKEKENLNETIYLLRSDVERGARRESKLAEALAKEASGEGPVPQIFMQKLKETNDLLLENAKENRQMADTLQFLTEERRTLQNRIVELESGLGGVITTPHTDLEERANHLFGKYLKSESFRKALVHQKRYLLLLISATEQNEHVSLKFMKTKDKKRKSFRGVVFMIIAISRMKYIVNRWHTGKRIGAKALFSSHQLPRRSASATTNNWTKIVEINHPNSPPSRDRIASSSQKSTNVTFNIANALTGTKSKSYKSTSSGSSKLTTDQIEKFNKINELQKT